jgi:hypothetical protein
MTIHGLTEEDTIDRNMWRNLVLGEGNQCRVEKSLDDNEMRNKNH